MEKEELLKMNAADFLSQHYSEMPAHARKSELWFALKWLTLEELCTYTYSTFKRFRGVGQFTALSFERILNANGLHFAEEKNSTHKPQQPQKQTIEGAKAPLTIEDAPTAIDWEQRRYEIAKALLPVAYNLYFSDSHYHSMVEVGIDEEHPEFLQVINQYVLEQTDEMIKELQL